MTLVPFLVAALAGILIALLATNGRAGTITSALLLLAIYIVWRIVLVADLPSGIDSNVVFFLLPTLMGAAGLTLALMERHHQKSLRRLQP